MDFFVIGSNSFSGSNFVNCVLKKGLSVSGISRSEEIDNSFLPYRWSDDETFLKNFNFHMMDLNNDLEDLIALIDEKQNIY